MPALSLTCASKPGSLLSRNWLHTPDCNTVTNLTVGVELNTMYAAAATNDQDINDIFGKGGSHAAPNTVQTGGGPGQRSGQGSTQSGGQKTSQSGGKSGGQSASKPSSGTPSSDSASSGSAATNFGQGVQVSTVSCTCVFCVEPKNYNRNQKTEMQLCHWLYCRTAICTCLFTGCLPTPAQLNLTSPGSQQ